jgi:hypothetical protein
MAHPLGVTNRIRDRDGAAMGGAEQRKPIELGGVNNRFKVSHQHIKRGLGRFAVRETAAARVVAMKTVAVAERIETHMGVCQSRSMFVSQWAARTSGNPLPCTA